MKVVRVTVQPGDQRHSQREESVADPFFIVASEIDQLLPKKATVCISRSSVGSSDDLMEVRS